MSTTAEINITSGLSFALSLLLLRAAMETIGLVERFAVRQTAFNDPYSPWFLLGFGVAFLLTSVLVFSAKSR